MDLDRINSVLIIHPEGNTLGNPTLKCVVDMLLERDVAVEVRSYAAPGASAARPGFVHRVQGPLLRRLKSLAINRLRSPRLGRLAARLESLLFPTRADLVVGVDRRGLIEAGFLHEVAGTPLVLFSFEIMFAAETSPAFKVLERRASRKVAHWFVQDELRAAELARENGLDPARCSLVPLASAGPGQAEARRLRDVLGIAPQKKVAILLGSITPWAMAGEIVAGAAAWPADWVLIVHERYGRTAASLAALGIAAEALQSGRVLVSDSASQAVDDMGQILAGVDAGLALYRPMAGGIYTGRNLECIGLASGKISTFLRYGVPVVMNRIGRYADLAQAHGFGVVVDEAGQIGAALAGLDLPGCGARGRAFFAGTLDFRVHEAAVWARLCAVAARGRGA